MILVYQSDLLIAFTTIVLWCDSESNLIFFYGWSDGKYWFSRDQGLAGIFNDRFWPKIKRNEFEIEMGLFILVAIIAFNISSMCELD